MTLPTLILSVYYLFVTASVDILENNNTRLTQEMYDFFTKVLEKKYQEKNEVILYEKFLSDYFNFWINKENVNSDGLDLEVNKERLVIINNKLFKRDLSHYYFYFPEVIILNAEDNISDAQELFRRYSDTPIVLIKTERITFEKSTSKLPLSKMHSVIINPKGGFIKKLHKSNFKTVTSLTKSMELVGEIPFFNLASLLSKTEVKEELQYQAVREIIAVMFWKYLCMEAGVDFYSPPNDFKK
jgi:hypothetical protein